MHEAFYSKMLANELRKAMRGVPLFDRRERKILLIKDEKRRWLEMEGYQMWKRIKEERKFAELSHELTH